MEIVLHIGTEKTGTTSIQHFLERHNRLLRSVGVAPACALDGSLPANASFLATASAPDPGPSLLRGRTAPFETYRESIRQRVHQAVVSAERAGLDRVVFSSEHLSSRLVTKPDIERLRGLFGDQHSFSIVCYLRRQDELLLGAQAEGIKFGNPDLELALPDLEADDEKYGRPYYDHEHMLGLWEQVFGDSSLQVGVYAPSLFERGNVVSDFVAHMLELEVPPDGELMEALRASAAIRANKRLSAEGLFALATLNSRPGSDPKKNRQLLARLDNGDDTVLVDPDRLAAFLARFDASNRRVARKYLGRDQLFPGPPRPYRYFDFKDPERQLHALIGFLEKCAAELQPPQ